jgi:uncharacterized protein YhbP (UPF0306 family)
MTVEEIVRTSIAKANIMQLGTTAGNQPWICTVHFYADEDLNFYWCSDVTRRHSKELENNSKAAAYFLVHENTPDEDYVIGISVEGTAELLKENPEAACKGYCQKLGKPDETLRALLSSQKAMYKLTPKNFVLFNNKDFPDNTRQEWAVQKEA